jgi:ketosteroid isomerase-like protein
MVTQNNKIEWSVAGFAAFWSRPDPALVPPLLTEDVVGVWPGSPPVRGRDAYTKVLADLLELMPDLRLEVAEHATNGEFTFVRWIMHATGADGPFEMSGIDRIRLRDGLVCENVIRLDRGEFAQRSGLRPPF